MDKKPRRELNDVKRVSECDLPGHTRAIQFDSIAAFEAHFYAEHAFRCTVPLPYSTHATTLSGKRHAEESAQRCNKTFPSEHILSLHVEECHSTLALQRKERGEKIVRATLLKQFACFEPLCGRFFATPKHRRHHLIAVHHYPPEYFFAVTNHGVGKLRNLYGDGASLVRKTWKTKSGNKNISSNDRSDEMSQNLVKQDVEMSENLSAPDAHSMANEEGQSTTKPEPTLNSTRPSSPTATMNNKRQLDSPSHDTNTDDERDPDSWVEASLEDALTQLSSLSFVPRSLQTHR